MLRVDVVEAVSMRMSRYLGRRGYKDRVAVEAPNERVFSVEIDDDEDTDGAVATVDCDDEGAQGVDTTNLDADSPPQQISSAVIATQRESSMFTVESLVYDDTAAVLQSGAHHEIDDTQLTRPGMKSPRAPAKLPADCKCRCCVIM